MRLAVSPSEMLAVVTGGGDRPVCLRSVGGPMRLASGDPTLRALASRTGTYGALPGSGDSMQCFIQNASQWDIATHEIAAPPQILKQPVVFSSMTAPLARIPSTPPSSRSSLPVAVCCSRGHPVPAHRVSVRADNTGRRAPPVSACLSATARHSRDTAALPDGYA